MCGIFGVINTNEKIDEGRVLAARDILAHRGPDDAGIYLSPKSNRSLDFARDDTSTSSVQAHKEKVDSRFHGNDKARNKEENNYTVALAHRRLSIIDLSASGHQPMLSGEVHSEKRIAKSAESLEQNAEVRPFDYAQGDGQAAPRYAIVFNGEIYNFRDLIPRLSFDISHLTSSSDTEVILNLYAQYGKDCLQHLRGMFAFAIWDDQEKTLFAARDRFGIKPFYYLHNENEFIFSSELKAIKHYKKNLTISKEGIDAFLRTGSVPAPLTIYNEVASMLPGQYLIMHNAQCTMYNYWNFGEMMVDGKWLMDDGKKVLDSRLRGNDGQDIISNEENVISTNEVRRNLKASEISQSYNEPVPSPEGMALPEMTNDVAQSLRGEQLQSNLNSKLDSRLRGNDSSKENEVHTSSLVSARDGTSANSSSITHHSSLKKKYDDDAKQKIRTALLDTVKAHMVSDVEVGAFLSGGIDSTAIVSLMRQVGQEKIKTVSVVFPGNKLDESKYARLAAKTYNTEHIEIPFYEKDLLDDFENIMSVMDQPTIDGINTYFVSKAAKQAGLKVVLSGLGGDELFGGYPSFRNIPKYQKIKNLPFAKMFMKAAAPLLKNKLPAKAIEYFLHPDSENAEYKLVRGLFTDSELKSLGWSCHPELVEGSVISTIEGRRNPKDFSVEDSFEMTNSQNGSVISTTEGRRNLKNFSVEDSIFKRNALAEMTTMQHISYLESCYYMRNQLLRDSDVFSMAHSLELRVPFVDHLLYAAVLPYLDSGFDKNYPKKMLVDVAGDIPDEIVHRPKFGFTFPFDEWIRNGQLKDLMNKKLKDLDSKLNIDHSKLNIERAHWSRSWALFILSRYV